MSLELEVRRDDGYSRSALRQRIEAFLLDKWSAEKERDDFLLYTGDGCHVEVSLGRSEGPDSSSDTVAWVGFRVPAGASFQSADRSLRMAMAVAHELGWQVFDPQRNEYLDPSELEAGPPFREAVARLGREARLAGWRDLSRKLARRARRQSVAGGLVMFVLGCGAALIAGWLFRFSFDTRPILSLILAATVGIGAFALDVVTDVLGEVHQEAIRPRMAAGMDMPPHPRAGRHGRGHRFAAYQRSWAG